jgi:lipid-A-disaccharide synthase
MIRPLRIYLIAGESSGDAHGALLMRELSALHREVEFYGAGGPEMKAIAGDQLIEWTQEAAVVGVWDVAVKWSYFTEKFNAMSKAIRELKPDAVIFIDFPGFNLRMTKYLRRKNYTGKLIYYISPQVWAWNRGRIPMMAKVLDLMMCIFPFEKSIYEASGLRTEFVGHPMVEELEHLRIAETRDPQLIALLPGSRTREVKRILPVMLEAARILQKRDLSIRFEVSATSRSAAETISQYVIESGVANVSVQLKNSKQLMQRAVVGLVASGTATMEASFFGLPFVLIYKVSWFTYIPARLLIRVKYLGMPNILAGKEIVPEFIQHGASPDRIAEAVWMLYSDSKAREAMVRDLDRVASLLKEGTPENRPAVVVLREIAGSK